MCRLPACDTLAPVCLLRCRLEKERVEARNHLETYAYSIKKLVTEDKDKLKGIVTDAEIVRVPAVM